MGPPCRRDWASKSGLESVPQDGRELTFQVCIETVDQLRNSSSRTSTQEDRWRTSHFHRSTGCYEDKQIGCTKEKIRLSWIGMETETSKLSRKGGILVCQNKVEFSLVLCFSGSGEIEQQIHEMIKAEQPDMWVLKTLRAGSLMGQGIPIMQVLIN